MSQKDRLIFLDTMRGFAIFSVIYSHIILFWGNFQYDTWFNHYFCIFQMPLFFFISGFLSYSRNLTSYKLKKGLTKKIISQVMPAVIILLPMSYIFGDGFVDALFRSGKMGYWFTISLAETFFIFTVITVLFKRMKEKQLAMIYIFTAVLITLFMMILVITNSSERFYEKPIVQLLSLQFGIGRMPFFFIGATVKIFYDQFKKYILNWYVIIPVTIISVLPIMQYPAFRHFNGYLSLLTVFFVFYVINNYLQKSKSGKILAYMGVNALPIYLLHYIFIFSLMNLSVTKHLIDFVTKNSAIEFLVVGLIAITILLLTLLLDKILVTLGLHKYIFFEFLNINNKQTSHKNA